MFLFYIIFFLSPFEKQINPNANMVYYGFAVFRTSICKIPIHVALYIEVQLLLLQVLTRRMQLGLKHSMAEIEEGGVPAKGKGKGRGGKGRGRGRGRAKSSNPAPEVPETENVEVGEPSFKKRTKATTPATTPAPDPKAKAKSKSRSKRSQKKEPGAEVVENQDASGSRDGLPAALSHDAVPTAASSDAAPAVPKRRRLRRVVDAEVAPPPNPEAVPAINAEVPHGPVPNADHAEPPHRVAEVPARPMPDADAEAGGLPVGENAADPEVVAVNGLDGESVAKIRAWSRLPQRWQSLSHLFAGLFSEPRPENLPKLTYYTLSMYWKSSRVGLVQKPKKNILSFGSAGSRRIGLALRAVDDYVPRITWGHLGKFMMAHCLEFIYARMYM